MKALTDIVAKQQAARPASDDPLTEQLFNELTAIAEELCVARDRLATCQTLAADNEPCDDAAIDRYVPDEAETRRRLDAHTAFFAELFSRLTADRGPR